MTAKEQALADDMMRAEIAKLIAETIKINSERFWIPFTVFATATIAITTIVSKLL